METVASPKPRTSPATTTSLWLISFSILRKWREVGPPGPVTERFDVPDARLLLDVDRRRFQYRLADLAQVNGGAKLEIGTNGRAFIDRVEVKGVRAIVRDDEVMTLRLDDGVSNTTARAGRL